MALEVYTVVKIEKNMGKFMNLDNANKTVDDVKRYFPETNFAIIKTVNGNSEIVRTTKAI